MNEKFIMVLLMVFLVVASGFTYANLSDGKMIDTISLGDLQINVDNENSVVKVMGDIYIPADRVVNGDVVGVMGNVKIDGIVNGNVVAVLGDVEVNNKINGDVVSVLGEINKGENAVINGEFVEVNEPNIDMTKIIGHREHEFKLPGVFKFFNMVVLFGIASLILALMPRHIKTMTRELHVDFFRKVIIGFAAIILIPLIILVSFVSIIGIPLVPVIISIVIIGKFIGYVPMALYVGTRIQKTANTNLNIFIELFFGAIVLWLIRLVPFVGGISYVIVTILAMGLIIDTKFGTNRPWFKKKEYKNDMLPEINEDGPPLHSRGKIKLPPD